MLAVPAETWVEEGGRIVDHGRNARQLYMQPWWNPLDLADTRQIARVIFLLT